MEDLLKSLWPRPKKLRTDGTTPIPPHLFRLVSTSSDREWISDLQARLDKAVTGTSPPAQLKILTDTDLPPQGYRLALTLDGGTLVGADAAGLHHGIATLIQLRSAPPGESRPEPLLPLVIEDSPDFQRRGVMLDVSRGRVPRMDSLYELTTQLANWKCNEVELYFEHSFAYADHGRVWQGASPITAEEIRSLDAHCRAHGIELIPNQQSFGHLHRWLKHDRYRPLAECPDGVEHAFGHEREPFSLCPTDPASLDFLASLYDELLPNFESSKFNVGLDETFDLGMGRSKATCDERGTGRVYLDFLRSVHRLVGDRGSSMRFWADIVLERPEHTSELPGDVTPLLWGYEADHPFSDQAKVLADTGLPFYVCPGTSSWQSIAGRWTNAKWNLSRAAVQGQSHGASGYLITDWGDRGHHQPLPVSLPGFLIGAGHAWNTSTADDPPTDSSVADLLDRHVFRDAAGRTGRWLLGLGDAYRRCGARATNGSALFFLLAFADKPFPPERVSDLSSDPLSRLEAELAADRSRALSGRPSAWGGALVTRELEWIDDVLVWTCRYGRARLSAGRCAPTAAVDARTAHALADQLEQITLRHRDLWMQRSRPGGIDESCGWLDRVSEPLRTVR